jgi:hypothetical protein
VKRRKKGCLRAPSIGGVRLDPNDIQKVVREDFFPLARQSYDAARAKDPALGGTIELELSILGDPSIGGVVNDATLGDKTTIDDAAMQQTCMRESMTSVTFDAPPRGGEVTVVYSIVFSPDEPGGD